MKELELGRLNLRHDSGVVVLTNLRVFYQRKQSFWGTNSTTIPLRAMTGLKVTWKRSELVLFLGILSLGVSVFAWLEIEYALVRYLLFLNALLWLVGFPFCKENKLEITTPTTTISGHPASYQDAKRFCDLVMFATFEKMQVSRETGVDPIPIARSQSPKNFGAPETRGA